jgi:hypothetical protein
MGWLYGCVFIHRRAKGTDEHVGVIKHQVKPHPPERVEEEEEAQQPGDEPSEDGPGDTGVAVGWLVGRKGGQSISGQGGMGVVCCAYARHIHTYI